MQIKCKTSAAVLSTRLLFHFSPYQIIDKAVYCLALRLGKSSDAVFVPLVNSYLDLIMPDVYKAYTKQISSRRFSIS